MVRSGAAGPDKDRDVAGPDRSAWWQSPVAYIAELQGKLDQITAGGLGPDRWAIAAKVQTHLDAARAAANRPRARRFLSSLFGSDHDRASANIHEAEMKLMRLAPEEELAQLGPSILASSQQYLGATDPRRAELERQLQRSHNKITPAMRELAISAFQASSRAEEMEASRARSFRNILSVSSALATILAGVFVIWGFLDPPTIAGLLCFEPRDPRPPYDVLERVCPTGNNMDGADALLVEAFGAAAAAFAGAISLRKMQGTSTPYSIPVLLLLLRIPVGALAALLGVILIRGGFIPGLSNLDNGPQIIAWAILFGVLQESVTHLVDRQGSAVLSNVHGTERRFQTPDELTTDPAPGPEHPASAPAQPPPAPKRRWRLRWPMSR